MEWIRICLTSGYKPGFLAVNGKLDDMAGKQEQTVWDVITPRIMMFQRFFEKLTHRSDPVGIVEAMHSSGITSRVLDTLPEAVLVPLRDAISKCQARPPPSWSTPLLELVNRTDISLVLAADQKPRAANGNVLVSTLPCYFAASRL